jgi:hypothetical protein
MALSGCLARVPRQRLAEPASIAVVYVVDPAHSGDVGSPPEALKQAVAAELDGHNLRAVDLPIEVVRGQRLTDARFEALKRARGDAAFVLLVEQRVQFFSQLDGRYRWEVGTTLVAAAHDGSAAKDAFELPVVLVYDHEKEGEAINAAASDVAMRVGVLMDGILAGRDPAPAAAPPASKPAAAPAQTPAPAVPGAPSSPSPEPTSRILAPAGVPAPAASAEKPIPSSSPSPSPSSSAPTSIYFVMVDRFQNGDSRNDGAIDVRDPHAFHGGDVQGLIDRLDWIQSLGFDTIWLSPVFATRPTSWHGHGAFHGYWTWELGQVEPRFGDELLIRKLRAELNRRSLKLVLDLVLNHVGPDAPLVSQRPEWFHRRGAVQNWNDATQLVMNDVHGLPDLAVERQDVYDFLLGATRRWLRPGAT